MAKAVTGQRTFLNQFIMRIAVPWSVPQMSWLIPATDLLGVEDDLVDPDLPRGGDAVGFGPAERHLTDRSREGVPGNRVLPMEGCPLRAVQPSPSLLVGQ